MSLNIECDRSHSHEPWGFSRDAEGKQVWATSLESKYPRKMCVALVNLVLDFLATNGLTLRATSLDDALNPLQIHQQSQMSVGLQPKPSRIPPIVADSCSVGVFYAKTLEDIPCSLMSKLPRAIQLFTKERQPVTVPQYSRFLRFSAISAPDQGGDEGVQNLPLKRKLAVALEESEQHVPSDFGFEVAFGLPWSYKGFIEQACRVGHPALKDCGVPNELQTTVEKHMQWTDEQMAAYRISWCRKWVVRAKELEVAEQEDAATRHPEVAKLTREVRGCCSHVKSWRIFSLKMLMR